MSDSDCLAVVTGTSSGIGLALAHALIDGGWAVLGVARRPVDMGHERYQHLQVDLGDLSALKAVVDEHVGGAIRRRRWRRVGLVNNAAAPGALRGLEQSDPLELARVFAVNAVAPMYLMGYVAGVTPPSASLRIVNVTSGAGVRGFAGIADYGSSKAALRLGGMALAAELDSPERPGGRRDDAGILDYQPGAVDTEMQALARATPREQLPWKQMFVDFVARGILQPPSAVVGEIVDFLAGDVSEPFEERRFTLP